MEYKRCKDLDSFTITGVLGAKQNKFGKTVYPVMIAPEVQLDMTEAEFGQCLSNEVRAGRVQVDGGKCTVDILGRTYSVKHTTKSADFGDGLKEFVVNYLSLKENNDSLI